MTFSWMKPTRQDQGIEHGSRNGVAAATLGLVVQEPHVETVVVRHQDRPVRERPECADRFFHRRSVCHHLIGDAGELDDGRRDRHIGADERLEVPDDGAAAHTHGPDLDDGVVPRDRSRGLDVDGDEVPVCE
jgi:hypothetical protein